MTDTQELLIRAFSVPPDEIDADARNWPSLDEQY